MDIVWCRKITTICLLTVRSIWYRDISVVSIFWLNDTYHIIHFSYTILQTIHFCLNLGYFWLLKFTNFWEICGYIKFFGSKTRQNVLLIHDEYHFMCILICIISLKINDTEPYCGIGKLQPHVYSHWYSCTNLKSGGVCGLTC